ncbi:AAA family ATPase [Arthrobacter sp. LAR12-1-1.1]
MLINGLPGSGKTTLCRQLGQALSWPVIAKDKLKEALADIAFGNVGTAGVGRSRLKRCGSWRRRSHHSTLVGQGAHP